MTVNFTAVYCPRGAEDTGRDRQAGSRRPRPRRQDHRPRPARRRHGGDLHRSPSDARADRRDGDPGGRRRGRDLDPLGRAHDARAADRRGAARRTRRTTCSSSSAARSPATTPSELKAAGRRGRLHARARRRREIVEFLALAPSPCPGQGSDGPAAAPRHRVTRAVSRAGCDRRRARRASPSSRRGSAWPAREDEQAASPRGC